MLDETAQNKTHWLRDSANQPAAAMAVQIPASVIRRPLLRNIISWKLSFSDHRLPNKSTRFPKPAVAFPLQTWLDQQGDFFAVVDAANVGLYKRLYAECAMSWPQVRIFREAFHLIEQRMQYRKVDRAMTKGQSVRERVVGRSRCL
jgi:hypothetical protein